MVPEHPPSAEGKAEQHRSGNVVSRALYSFNIAVNEGLARFFEALGRFVGRRSFVVIVGMHQVLASILLQPTCFCSRGKQKLKQTEPNVCMRFTSTLELVV